MEEGIDNARSVKKLTLPYQSDNKADLGNHQKISIILSFPETLERTMYNTIFL